MSAASIFRIEKYAAGEKNQCYMEGRKRDRAEERTDGTGCL
jgi:hypothetical protein